MSVVYPYTVCYSITLRMSHSAFPVHALLISSFSFLVFRVAVAHIQFTTTFMLPWALISSYLLFGGQSPMCCCQKILGFGSKEKEAAVWLSGGASVSVLPLQK